LLRVAIPLSSPDRDFLGNTILNGAQLQIARRSFVKFGRISGPLIRLLIPRFARAGAPQFARPPPPLFHTAHIVRMRHIAERRLTNGILATPSRHTARRKSHAHLGPHQPTCQRAFSSVVTCWGAKKSARVDTLPGAFCPYRGGTSERPLPAVEATDPADSEA
jgi:hypothetical protein